MTSGLRKAHKYIWLLILLIIPIIIFFSIKELDIFSSKNVPSSQLKGSNKVSLKSVENEIFKTSLYESSIEIILKIPLKTSSSIVYAMDAHGNKSGIIGQLSNVGIYSFNIRSLPKGIIIYDDLKDIEITKIYF